MLVSKTIPNLINGVSQQPDSLRLASQAEIVFNAYPTTVDGNEKRPASRHLAKLMDTKLDNAKIYTVRRDSKEKYKVVFTNGDLAVFDIAGNRKTVNFPEGKDYLNNSNPRSGFATLSIADYTFIANKEVKVEMDAELSPKREPEGLVFVKQASNGATYSITLNGTKVSTSTASTGNVDTLSITSALKTAIEGLGAEWVVETERSTIWVRRADNAEFEIKAEDSKSGTLIDCWTRKTQRFSDLPTVAPDGYHMEVIGDNTSNFDNYYVVFECQNEGATFDKGIWKETVDAGIPFKFKRTTMPHGLIREADGTFTFKALDWEPRKVGDELSAPEPTFVGRKINAMFYYKNRLGVLSDENAVLAEAAEFFNFWPTTVTTLVDSDPIDAAASTSKVSILQHAVQFQEDLLFFSDQTQFKLDFSDVLSPSTADIKPLTEFEASVEVPPVAGGKTIFFAVPKNEWTGVREYYYDSETNTRDALEITSHVPKYIPGGVYRMACSTNEDILALISDRDPQSLYIYKYFWAGNDKLQSAWFHWKFSGKVLDVDFIETDMYLITQYDDGVYLEVLSVQPGYCDPSSPFEFHLDRKVSDEAAPASYDGQTGITTWTLPYATTEPVTVVARYPATPDSGILPGQELGTVIPVGNLVQIVGDYSNVPVFLGLTYEMRYRFSSPVMKETADGGGQAIIGEGRLQIRYWSVQYDRTGYFRVEVTPKYRDTSVYTFTGHTLGAGSNILGEVPLGTGRFRFPVLAQNTQVTIDIINDTYLPSRFTSAEWEGTFNIRSRRV